MKHTDHVRADGKLKAFVCTNCGAQHSFILPMEIKQFTKNGRAFLQLHKNCKPKTQTT